ncbi:MAG: LCP family protein [Clostridia bacterium]|nr:LCP family protein [Clostridia bacterium]
MLKRIAALLIALVLLLPAFALGENEAKPTPITPLTEEEIPETPEGIHYILIVCSDRDESSAKDPGNTDGIMLVALDTVGQRVMLISFIRDMLVLRPDGQYGRINGIAKRFSLEDLVATINSHFGLRIEKYILVNWTGVAAIIDDLGGVEVTLTNGEAIRLRDKQAYMRDWAQPELNGAGTYRLRGYAAVTYMRIRSDTFVDGEQYDYRRTTRARNVVASLADSLRTATWQTALKLATSTVWQSIAATNMTLADMMEAAAWAFALRNAEIEQMRVPINGTGSEFYYLEMATQQIDVPANREALHDFIFNGTYAVRGGDGDEEWEWNWDWD